MAQQFFSDIDLKLNQLINMLVEKRSSHPSNPTTGRIYYNTVDNAFYGYDGEWKNLGQSISASQILSLLLTVDGSGSGLDSDTLDGKSSADFATSAQGVLAENSQKYHGIESRPVGVSSPLPTHITTTTFTLSATANPITYYYQGIKVTVNSDRTVALSEGEGLYYIYFNGSTGNILASKTFPGVTLNSNVIIASVNWNGTDYGLIRDERHGYARNHAWHSWAHNTVGCRYESGLTLTHNGGTGASATFSTTGGEIYDEDINFILPSSSSFPTPNTCRLLWQIGASAYTFDKNVSTIPFKVGANNRPVYVRVTDYAVVQMNSATNRYMNFFVYATSDLHTPIYVVAETVSSIVATNNGYTSLANARAVPFPNIGSFGAELKPIYRLIVRADGVLQAIDTSLDDYRLVSSLPQSAGNTATTASEVTFKPSGNYSGTSVQVALEEVQTSVFQGSVINSMTAKDTPVDADAIGYADSEASNTLKKITWANIKTFLKTYFDALYIKPLSGQSAYDPQSLPSGTQVSTTISITGAALGDIVSVSFSLALQGIDLWGEVSSTDTVTVYFRNDTGSSIDLGSGTINIKILR